MVISISLSDSAVDAIDQLLSNEEENNGIYKG